MKIKQVEVGFQSPPLSLSLYFFFSSRKSDEAVCLNGSYGPDITSNVCFFYQQVYFNLFTYGFVPDIMKINKSCWNRQFFENEFISIAKTMGFEGYSET